MDKKGKEEARNGKEELKCSLRSVLAGTRRGNRGFLVDLRDGGGEVVATPGLPGVASPEARGQ